MRHLLCVLSFFVTSLSTARASDISSSGAAYNTGACVCYVTTPDGAQCVLSTVSVTVVLTSLQTTTGEHTISISGGDAAFDAAGGPTTKTQVGCPSVGMYTVYTGTVLSATISISIDGSVCGTMSTNGCPTEIITATPDSALAGKRYGAHFDYSYSPCVNGSWFVKENVTQQNTPTPCLQTTITQQTNPVNVKDDGTVGDRVFDGNGPPTMACSDTTDQTVYLGPTVADVEHCTYHHTQIITVTISAAGPPASGTVTASVNGISTSANF